MEANKILSSDVLDLIFDNRNKAYGAYDLRKTYNKRILLALGITTLVALLAIAGSVIGNAAGDDTKKVKMQEVTMTKIEPKEDKKDEPPPPPPPPPPKAPEPPKIEMKQFTPPKIVEDEKVQEPPPEQEELKDVKIDIKNMEGIKDQGIVIPPQQIDAGKGVIEVKQEVVDDDKIFEKVEIEAEFPGGQKAWAKYLLKNLNGDAPTDNGAEPGTYRVIVKFVVDKKGKISDVRALTNFGKGMEEEAIRVIKTGPNWIPAVQNGSEVSAQRQQPVVFQVVE